MKFDEIFVQPWAYSSLNPALAILFKIRNACMEIRRFCGPRNVSSRATFGPRTVDCTTRFTVLFKRTLFPLSEYFCLQRHRLCRNEFLVLQPQSGSPWAN